VKEKKIFGFFMDIEYIPVIVALSGVCIAVYTDLRRRIISDKLNYSMIAIGLTFYLIFGASKGNLLLAASGAIGAAFSFGIGYALW
jgi:Flp pilus assembly protein protease CpaA